MYVCIHTHTHIYIKHNINSNKMNTDEIVLYAISTEWFTVLLTSQHIPLDGA